MDGVAVHEHLTVRWLENEGYDVTIDSEVIRFMGITNQGTYTAEIAVKGPASVRSYRQQFKEWVMECLEKGIPPCEGEFD